MVRKVGVVVEGEEGSKHVGREGDRSSEIGGLQ